MTQDNSLPARIYGIPSKWSICCWLADSLTTALMKSGAADAHEKMLAILKLIAEVSTQLQNSCPSILNEVIFDLLTRIIHKIRSQLILNPVLKIEGSGGHVKAMFGLSDDFLRLVYDKILSTKEDQEKEQNSLLSSFLKSMTEFTAAVFLPFDNVSRGRLLDNPCYEGVEKPGEKDGDEAQGVDPWFKNTVNS